jgi:hypothetical protein
MPVCSFCSTVNHIPLFPWLHQLRLLTVTHCWMLNGEGITSTSKFCVWHLEWLKLNMALRPPSVLSSTYKIASKSTNWFKSYTTPGVQTYAILEWWTLPAMSSPQYKISCKSTIRFNVLTFSCLPCSYFWFLVEVVLLKVVHTLKQWFPNFFGKLPPLFHKLIPSAPYPTLPYK